MTDWLVGHGVLTEIVSDHVTLDLDCSPVLSSVDFGDGADHLGHDDGVTEMGPDWLGSLTGLAVLDGDLHLLDESVDTGVDSMSEASFLSRSEHGNHVFSGELKKFLKFDSSVKLFFEWFFHVAKGLSLGSLEFLFGSSHII